MTNLVTVYCPECCAGHEVENSAAVFPCKSCGYEIHYQDFTCPPYIALDDHGVNTANLDGYQHGSFADRRELGGYCMVLENRGGRWDSSQYQLTITKDGKDAQAFEDFYVSSICMDYQNAYFDMHTIEGYQTTQRGIHVLPLNNYRHAEPELLCAGQEAAFMLAYQEYFVFVSNERYKYEVLIMPMQGGWVRKLCDGRRLNVVGNWLYYGTENIKDNKFQIHRVSLDGKQRVSMRGNESFYAEVAKLMANKNGVFYGDSDNRTRKDLFAAQE